MLKLGKEIGSGRTATVYRFNKNKIVKLAVSSSFRDFYEYEYKINKSIEKLFPKAAKVYDLIEINGKPGIIFEYIDGLTMIDYIAKKPVSFFREVKKLAQLQIEMHNVNCNDLIDLKDGLQKQISRIESLSGEIKSYLLRRIQKIPNNNILLHGDFHPENILCSKSGLRVIDWTNAMKGDPTYDVARTYFLLKESSMESLPIIQRFLFSIIRNIASRIFLKKYTKNSTVSKNEVKKMMLIVYGVRLTEQIEAEQNFLIKKILTIIKKKNKMRKN